MSESQSNQAQQSDSSNEAGEAPVKTHQAAEKLMWIPKKDYIKFTYIALMASSVIGIFAVFVGAVTGLGGLIGLAGIILAILGYSLYKREFSDAQLSHFKYVAIVFVASFFLGLLLSILVGGLAMITSPLISIAGLVAMFVGFRLNENRLEVTKDNAINELKSLKP